MTFRWQYLAAGLAMLSFGALCADNAAAKYAETKKLSLSVSIEKHYEVAFDANGGAGSMDNQQFTSGVAQALSANEYTNEGYYFAGWNTSADGLGTSYDDEELISEDLTNLGGDTVTLYAQWEQDAMHTTFEIDGTCVFHGYQLAQGGDGYITGTNCTARGVDYADGAHRYIDTGVKLYDSNSYALDYEVGFTITAYDPAHQYKQQGDNASQATFFNAKLENSARHWPGIAIRRVNDNIEVTQTITKPNGSFEKKSGNTPGVTPLKVAVTRVDGIVYYSFNDGPFTVLQNTNDTEDYFETTAWFGAAAKDDSTPMRYIDATMTDIYIKVGSTGANKHTVSFDAGGVVTNPADVTTIGQSKMGNKFPSVPNYVDTANGRRYFVGWYTGANGTGEKYTEDTIITHDLTLHAYWSDELFICSVGEQAYGYMQSCIDNAANGDTIALLDNIKTQVTVNEGQEITFDLNGFKWSDNDVINKPVIENYGKITVLNGTMTSKVRAGVLNNNPTGEMFIGNDARIVATGIRQAIYNNGGKLEIGGNAYLSAASGERAAVQNLNNGILTITGGTIISTSQEAVKNESGTLVIGVEDGTADNSTPVLQGATYGLNTSVDVAMYDGILRGKNRAINDSTYITATEDDATSVGIDSVLTEVVDGVTYKVVYFE